MGLKEFISGRRLRAAIGDSSDWKLTAATMWYGEEDLPRAAQAGDLTPEELEYAQGIIELTIQGERIAKTRKQWAKYISGKAGFPYRYTDSETTKAMKLHAALLELEPVSRAHPNATLEELIGNINRKLWQL